MNRLFVLLSTSLIMANMLGCQPFPEEKCPQGFISLGESVKACLSSPEAHTTAQENYNDASYQKNKEELIRALVRHGVVDEPQSVPNLEEIDIVITDVREYYNSSFLFYVVGWDFPDEESTAFDISAGFFTKENKMVYVNLTKPNANTPCSIVPHELLHFVSYQLYNDLDPKHERVILWKDVEQDVKSILCSTD